MTSLKRLGLHRKARKMARLLLFNTANKRQKNGHSAETSDNTISESTTWLQKLVSHLSDLPGIRQPHALWLLLSTIKGTVVKCYPPYWKTAGWWFYVCGMAWIKCSSANTLWQPAQPWMTKLNHHRTTQIIAVFRAEWIGSVPCAHCESIKSIKTSSGHT